MQVSRSPGCALRQQPRPPRQREVHLHPSALRTPARWRLAPQGLAARVRNEQTRSGPSSQDRQRPADLQSAPRSRNSQNGTDVAL